MNKVSGQKKIRILFVHYGDNWIRGSESCLLQLVENLDKNKYQPLVWCNSDALFQQLRQRHIPVMKSTFSILFGWTKPKFNVSNYFKLIANGVRIIRKYKIDIIHCNSGAPNQWMLPVSKIARVPLVLHLHSPYLLRDRLTLGLGFSPTTVGVSEASIRSLKSDGVPSNKLHVIYNGMKVPHVTEHSRRDIRNENDISENALLLATIGSLIHRKGIDTIIEALAKIIKRGMNVKLLIAGEGPERRNLETLCKKLNVSDRVIFLGEISNARNILHSGVDILLSGAREEAFGLTLVEAGFAKIPVIAPKIGGIPEVVQHTKTGLLVKPENPDAMANAIQSLYQNTDLRAQLGEAGHKNAVDKFSIEKYISSFESLYLRQLKIGANSKSHTTGSILCNIKILFSMLKSVLKVRKKAQLA